MSARWLKRVILGCMLAFCSACPVFGISSASPASDLQGHWAEAPISRWVEQGLVNGYADGSFRPDQPISRAEFVALVNRALGFDQPGEVAFRDLQETHWAYRDAAIAVRSNYITGYEDGTFRPDNRITRQEVAVIASRLLYVPNEGAAETDFADSGEIAEWAREAVHLSWRLGILTGYADRTFRPGKPLTRAEAVVILDRLIGARTLAIDEPGTYGPVRGTEEVYRDVIVRAPGVQLRNMVIHGNLTIAEQVGEGDVHLNNIAVHGSTYIYGGGENSIYVADTFLVSVTVDKKTGGIRLVVEGASNVAEVVLNTPATLDASVAAEAIGNVKLSEQLPQGSKVTLIGTFEHVEIAGSEISIEIPAGTIENLVAGEAAEGTIIELGAEAKVASLVLEAVAKVTGEGTVAKMTVSEKAAAQASIEVAVEEFIVPEGVEPPAVPERPSSQGSTDTIPNFPPQQPPSDNTPRTPLEEVAVSGVYETGRTLTASLTPASATAQYQWQRADEEDGDYVDIAGATESAYLLQSEDEGKWIRVKVTGTGSYTGTLTSAAGRALPASVNVAAQHFSVLNDPDGSGVIGYYVEFRLADATAADVREVTITLYNGDEEVASVTSGGLAEKYPQASVLSAPFDVLGTFDYEADENWTYSGWKGEYVSDWTEDLPDKAVIRVTFINGVQREAETSSLTGDTSVFRTGTISKTPYWGNPGAVWFYFNFDLGLGHRIGDLSSLKAKAFANGEPLSTISLKEAAISNNSSAVTLGGSFRSSVLETSGSWDLQPFDFDGTFPDRIVIEYETVDGKKFRFGQKHPVWVNEGYKPVARVNAETMESEGFASIQEAIQISSPGDYVILVDHGNHGTDPIRITQREGVNLVLEGLAGERAIKLKNRIIIDGANRHDGEETLTIRNFTFDFSDADQSGQIISAQDSDVPNNANNYAHNMTIEDVTFIGNRAVDMVAIKTTTGSTFGLTIRSCYGTGLHSLGQLHVAEGVLVEDCTVNNSESGINYYGNGEAVFRNLQVQGENYGIRAGQGSGTPQADGWLIIENSLLSAKYPVYLRGDAPMNVLIKGATLVPVEGGDEIYDITDPEYEIHVIREP